MKQKCEAQHEQLQKSDKKAKSVASMAAEESTKHNTATEFVKFLDSEVLLTLKLAFNIFDIMNLHNMLRPERC